MSDKVVQKMMISVLRCSLIYFSIIAIVSVHAECPDGWMYFKGSCYFYGHQDLNFQEAERLCTCLHYGSHLVSVETQLEDTFLRSFLSDLKDPNHWIGLTDEIVEGVWKWYADDTDATFTNWDSDQPNDGKNGNCVAIMASHKYTWADRPCSTLLRPLCEKTLNTEPDVIGK